LTERSGFFNSVNGDRKYDASKFAEYFASFLGNGIFPSPSTNLQIMANGDMTVTLKSGKAWINGYFYYNDSDLVLTLSTADGILNRIDRIVVQYNTTNRTITAKIKQGTFASSPVATDLERDSDAYELGLADIYVGAGVTSIIQSNITDLRMNSTYCGVVDSLITVDTSTLFTQFEDGFDTWFNSVKNTLSTDAAGNLLNLINNHKADAIYQVAEGTATAITLIISETLENGLPITFIASENNGGATTTVNSIPLYKPGTTIPPTLKSGRAYAIWYNLSDNCFFIKASAEGSVIASHVLAGETFSNDTDIGIEGTAPLKSGITYTPTTINQVITSGFEDGTCIVKGDANLLSQYIAKDITCFNVTGSHIGITAGDQVLLSILPTWDNPPLTTFGSSSPTKFLNGIQMNVAGTFRVSCVVNGANYSGEHHKYQFYKNDVAIGSVFDFTADGNAQHTISQDFTCAVGDIITLYGWYIQTGSGSGFEMKNFQICAGAPTTITYATSL